MGNVDTMRTSSSRREVTSENRPNAIGCMSGLFHLFSRHHNRSRKRLTSGSAKKKGKPTIINASPPTPPPLEVGDDGKKGEPRRRSCETPRSPTIQQEIRRPAPNAIPAEPESPRRPSALVARLMGLEEAPAPPVAVAVAPSQTEGGRLPELLRALEKCDEDLHALRRIIEAVRLAETHPKAVAPAVGSTGQVELDGGDWRKEGNGEQPSPVSVLDAIWSPRYRSKGSPNEKQGMAAIGSTIVKPSRMGVLFAGESYKKALDAAGQSCSFYHRRMIEAMPRVFEQKGGMVMESSGAAGTTAAAGGLGRQCWRRRKRRRSASRAVEESVEEVWEEGAWEERWEMGRVGVWVEDGILWDLVEEMVDDMFGWWFKLSLPSGSCRKRLSF